MHFVELLQQKRDQNKAFQKAFGIVAQRKWHLNDTVSVRLR
jgi:hypothetical protein